MSDQIFLNFLPVHPQDFSWTVYRCPFQQEKKDEINAYKTKLPENRDEDSNYSDYWICFEPRDGFEPFTCTSSTNHMLTLHVLWHAMLEKAKSTFSSDEYISESHSTFIPQIDFVLKEHSVGKELVSVQPYFLKKGQKFGFLVNFHFEVDRAKQADRKTILQLSLSLDRNYGQNKDYYSDKLGKVKDFIDKYLSRLATISICENELEISHKLYPVPSNQLKKKTYQFCKEAEHSSQFIGLRDYGPYKTISERPYLLFIFEKTRAQLANTVYKALTGTAYPTFKGMEKMFQLKIGKEDVDKITFMPYTEGSIRNVASEIDGHITRASGRRMIGVFIEHAGDVNPCAPFSPYYFLKYEFAKRAIPLQAITIEKINARDGLKWSASGIGLQVFSKMGGVPWKVKPSHRNCLIFGIGSAHKRDDDGKIVKYFAYSICLDSSGIYKKIDLLSESSSSSEYVTKLKTNFIAVVKAAVTENQNITRCVFHLPFKLKSFEIDTIRSTVEELGLAANNVEVHFIKINTKNRFFGFADNNSKVPYESAFVKIGIDEYLVWFEGLQYGKENVHKRIGNPVHIEFMKEDRGLEESEKQSFLQDIINLSGANWRGFNAKLAPISIFYPELIAKYISEFRRYGDDDISFADMQYPWFL